MVRVSGGVAGAAGLGGVLDLVAEVGRDDVVVPVECVALERVLGVWISGLEQACNKGFPV